MTWRRTLVVTVALFASNPAKADETSWLSGSARDISRSLSASRDAPVVEYMYGPRSQASVGGDLALVAFDRKRSRLRLGGSLLFAFENAHSQSPAPFELWRVNVELSAAWSLTKFAQRFLGPRSKAEISLSLGRAASLATRNGIRDPIEPTDIPFGGGGYYLMPEIGVRLTPLDRLEVDVRFDYRLFTNVFADIVGQDDVANALATGLNEGMAHSPSLHLTAQWRLSDISALFVAWSGSYLAPHDEQASDGYFMRLLLGAAIAGGAGRVVPQVSVDIGNGLGLLINRRELRFSLGVRYAWH